MAKVNGANIIKYFCLILSKEIIFEKILKRFAVDDRLKCPQDTRPHEVIKHTTQAELPPHPSVLPCHSPSMLPHRMKAAATFHFDLQPIYFCIIKQNDRNCQEKA